MVLLKTWILPQILLIVLLAMHSEQDTIENTLVACTLVLLASIGNAANEIVSALKERQENK